MLFKKKKRELPSQWFHQRQLDDIFTDKLSKAAKNLSLYLKKFFVTQTLGTFQSRFQGTSLEFRDFRKYEIGDDVRRIHWMTSQRTLHPVVKTFDKEFEPNILFLLDLSTSMTSASAYNFSHSKYECFLHLISLLSLSSLFDKRRIAHYPLHPNNTQHQIFFSRKKEKLFYFISTLLDPSCILSNPPSYTTPLSLKKKLAEFIVKKISSSFIIFISDFWDPLDFEKELFHLSRKNRILLISISTPSDRGYPTHHMPGLYEVMDPDDSSGQMRFMSTFFRKESHTLAKRHQERLESLNQLAKKTDCLHFNIDSHENLYTQVMHYCVQHQNTLLGTLGGNLRSRRTA